MFKRDFEFAAFTRSDRRRIAAKHCARLAQNDLAHVVEKFDRNLDVAQRAAATIHYFPGKGSNFLLQKVFIFCEGEIFDLNARRVSLLRWSECQMCLRARTSGMFFSWRQVQQHSNDQHPCDSEQRQ